jgi:hypothetical protein
MMPTPGAGLDRGRGRVFADLSCAIADGARVISDFRVMGDQDDVFGQVTHLEKYLRVGRNHSERGVPWLGRRRTAQ